MGCYRTNCKQCQKETILSSLESEHVKHWLLVLGFSVWFVVTGYLMVIFAPHPF